MLQALSLPWRGWLRRLGVTLARGGSKPPPEPVVIYTAANTFEADVIASRLAADNIPCWRRSESLGAAYGLTVGPLAQVDILVPAALAEQARAILTADADAVTHDDDV